MASLPPVLMRAARSLVRLLLLSLVVAAPAAAQVVNDPATEPIGANQSYPSLAELDGILVAAFADWRTASTNHVRCSYSLDSGATWIQLGVPPAPGTARWVTDPRVVASPVHGKFFIFGGANDYPLFGGLLGCVSLSFPGGVPTWGAPRMVRVTYPDSPQTILFGQDAAVSPTTGRLFAVSNYDNGAGVTSLDLQYSDDEGQSWSVPLPVDSVAARPLVRVHGNRVYVMNTSGTPAFVAVTVASAPSWWAAGRIPKLRDAMASGLPPGGYSNHVDIDDSGGAHDGRIYAVWTESYDFDDDPIPDPILQAPPVSEVEPDGTFAGATPFTVGDVLRGTIATSNSDLDHFRTHLLAGQRVVLWADSVGSAVTSLNLAVNDSLGSRPIFLHPQSQATGKLTFVAARADDYDFVLSAYFTGAVPQPYRLRTAPGIAGSEPARDQSDIVSAWSDDDGASWSPPVRVSGSAVGCFDDGPIVEVGRDGRPQVGWWSRTAANGTLDARWRLKRSNDAGATWQLGGLTTTTPSNVDWGMLTGTCFGVNAMLALSDRFVHAFAELEPTATVQTDVRAALQKTHLEVVSCGANYAGAPGSLIHPSVMVRNDDAYFTEPVRLAVSFDRDWPAAEDTVDVASGPARIAMFDFAIPDTAAAGTVRMQLTVSHFSDGLASCPVEVYVQAAAGVDAGRAVAFGLHRVWPNPAAARASVRYGVPRPAWVTLDVMDVHGRRVARLVDRLQGPGEHQVEWHGLGPAGRRLAAGIYLLELRSCGKHDVKRLVLLE